jgi:hypothetical protein
MTTPAALPAVRADTLALATAVVLALDLQIPSSRNKG